MPPLPAISGADLVKALQRAGFSLVRVRGSHHVMRKPGGPQVSVPVHGNRDIRRGTLRSILNDIGLTIENLRELL